LPWSWLDRSRRQPWPYSWLTADCIRSAAIETDTRMVAICRASGDNLDAIMNYERASHATLPIVLSCSMFSGKSFDEQDRHGLTVPSHTHFKVAGQPQRASPLPTPGNDGLSPFRVTRLCALSDCTFLVHSVNQSKCSAKRGEQQDQKRRTVGHARGGLGGWDTDTRESARLFDTPTAI